MNGLLYILFFVLSFGRSNLYISNNAKQFQKELSGDANLSFEVNGVSFDGIDDAGKLIDRKFGHGNSIFKEIDNGFDEIDIVVHNKNRVQSIIKQVEKQLEAVGNNGSAIRWEISTQLGTDGIEKIFKESLNPEIQKITVIMVEQKKLIY